MAKGKIKKVQSVCGTYIKLTKKFHFPVFIIHLEKEKATHSSTLAWRIPWTEELGGLQSTGRKESDTTERLHFYFLPY